MFDDVGFEEEGLEDLGLFVDISKHPSIKTKKKKKYM